MMRTTAFCVSLVAVCLLAGMAHAQTAYHDSVVIVLDGSGSMGADMSTSERERIVVAKEALKKVLLNVPETTHVGLMVFSRRHKDPWLYPLGPRDNVRLVQAIESVREGGGTPLGLHMRIGADRLLEERKKQFGYGTYKLLVVTDGEAGDQDRVERFTPEILSRGITIDVIGVDMNEDHTLATKVNSYRRADDPEALTEALSQVFAEVGGNDEDTASDTEFELLEGLPFEVAEALLSGLTAPSDTPIGQTSRSAEARQSPASSADSNVPPITYPAPDKDDGDGGFSLMPMVVFGIIVVMLVLTKGRRRR